MDESLYPPGYPRPERCWIQEITSNGEALIIIDHMHGVAAEAILLATYRECLLLADSDHCMANA